MTTINEAIEEALSWSGHVLSESTVQDIADEAESFFALANECSDPPIEHRSEGKSKTETDLKEKIRRLELALRQYGFDFLLMQEEMDCVMLERIRSQADKRTALPFI